MTLCPVCGGPVPVSRGFTPRIYCCPEHKRKREIQAARNRPRRPQAPIGGQGDWRDPSIFGPLDAAIKAGRGDEPRAKVRRA